MAIYRCPSCQLLLTEAEWQLGKCSACDTPLRTESGGASTSPVATPTSDATPANRHPEWFTWAFLSVGLLFLSGLILWQRPASVIPESNPSAAEDLARIEQKLQRLEALVNSTRPAKNGELAALKAKLDEFDSKIADLTATKANATAEAKTQRELLARVEARLEALAQRSFSPPAPPGPLEIRVISKDWNDAVPDNVQAVCISAARELWKHFPDRRLEPITVANSANGPMVVFGRGPDGERRVLLNVKGKFWAQCGYQFGHEFCHILCNYREGKNANRWFEEALCETASLFTLRGMAKTWAVQPPYPNWKTFSGALSDYVDEIERTTAPLDKLTLADWFAKNEPTLRGNSVDRPRNRVVALVLIKILERDPHHWQAVGYLNQWDAKDADQSFALYLTDWHQRVPPIHKPFVREVAGQFGISIK